MILLKMLLEGRGSCQFASTSISTTPSPAISKDTRKPPPARRRACLCHLCSRPSIEPAKPPVEKHVVVPLLETLSNAKPAVEEQVVVTSAQDPAKLSSNSMSLYLCLRPKACRKTLTPPIAARTGTRTPARAKVPEL
jgi:hypothetical protein